jgi:pimeloyl-ACP methyl ester carboxylesterase
MAAARAHQQGEFADDDELADLYRRELPLFAPVGVDVAGLGETMAQAGTNADALRHFNEVVSGSMDLRPLLARVEAPTLVIGGEIDAFGPPAQQEIADALPNATLVILPGADHFPFLEPGHQPTWERAVLEFLAA